MKREYFLIGLFLFLSCNSQPPSTRESTDPYIQNLKEQFPELQIGQSVYPQIEGLYQPNGLVVTQDCQRFIMSDYVEKTLFLMNVEGEIIQQTGGEGRGPEEYQSILNPHIGADSRLYVLDPLLFRINIYELDIDRLEFIKSIPYKVPENYFLAEIYVTEYGHFGLFQESPNGFFSPENHYYLYSLDEKFAIKDKLLEMPGHERLKFVTPQMTLYTPYEYSERTGWSLDNDWFYYFTTGDETIHRYHIVNGKKESLSFFEIEKRTDIDFFMEVVKENHPNSTDELFMKKLNELESLPLFSSFHVENQKVFLNVLATPGQDQVILYIDLVSREIKFFEAPYGFTPFSLCGNHLSGFEYSLKSEIRLMDIEIPFLK